MNMGKEQNLKIKQRLDKPHGFCQVDAQVILVCNCRGGDYVKAIDYDFHYKRIGGGITFYTYQLSIGVTFRYWPCIYAPSIRIHFGPIKIWGYILFKNVVGANKHNAKISCRRDIQKNDK